jgi:hypothetical protein
MRIGHVDVRVSSLHSRKFELSRKCRLPAAVRSITRFASLTVRCNLTRIAHRVLCIAERGIVQSSSETTTHRS